MGAAPTARATAAMAPTWMAGSGGSAAVGTPTTSCVASAERNTWPSRVNQKQRPRRGTETKDSG